MKYQKQINSLVALGALMIAFGHTQPAMAGHPRFTAGEAMQHTQAAAFIKCRTVVEALNEVSRNGMWYCRFLPDETIRASCKVKNPPSWLGLILANATCKERWWIKNYKTGDQQLHGCLYQMTKMGPFYKVKGNCRRGTFF